ncbi:hypothetical protein CYLTODRAFT_460685 [Cylindrobasidium torrendii FP15055 ss-10]|uniref:Uncharacterized protein n=1 Tax=Cylindrobasidium torrendii FP15055 ss-10 TaxID=1314674 RepID=A0A0D7ARW0_9AGAR|nr:hypothetical protein CYLTODRAFT_460685 [Cylindrobasidium torrendii FP15055 ss-10]
MTAPHPYHWSPDFHLTLVITITSRPFYLLINILLVSQYCTPLATLLATPWSISFPLSLASVL